MSTSLNRITIIGRLGKDVETSTTANGTSYARFSVATDEYGGKDTDGKAKYNTTWHNVTVWPRGQNSGLVEYVSKNLKKGSQVYVEGSLTSNKKEEVTYYSINAQDVIILGDRANASTDAQGEATSHSAKGTAAASTSKKAAPVVDDGDLPF